MSFKFSMNANGIKSIATGSGMKDCIDRAAQAALAAAVGSAPVETGEYRDSLAVTEAESDGDTVRALLYSDSPKWHWIEFGTADEPAQHVLEVAVTSVGLKFTPEAK